MHPIKFHRLAGQNLLRYNAASALLAKINITLISDSIGLRDAVRLLLRKQGRHFALHVLELYNISGPALFSEIFFRIHSLKMTPRSLVSFFKSYVYHFIRIIIFRVFLRKINLIIVSSDLRKNFLRKSGVDAKIIVLRNKPIITLEYKSDMSRNNCIVLIGNLNNRSDFLIVHEFAKRNQLYIYCYGISSSDIEWIRMLGLGQVVLKGHVEVELIPEILLASKFALCLYVDQSHNQYYSASSKLFEILYFGCIPIVSDNLGLIEELRRDGPNYLSISNLNEVDPNKFISNISFDKRFLFESELEPFKMELG
jgi:hypothetical protein